MNDLSYRINKEAILWSNPAKQAGFEVVLDGIPTNYFFNIKEFKKSSEKDGHYLIFEGPCDTMGCCGAFAQVFHEEDKIIWKRFYVESEEGDDDPLRQSLMPGSDSAHEISELHIAPDRRIRPPLEFNKIQYQKLAFELEKIVEDQV